MLAHICPSLCSERGPDFTGAGYDPSSASHLKNPPDEPSDLIVGYLVIHDRPSDLTDGVFDQARRTAASDVA